MRVIAGSARHLPLKTIEGDDVRPTTDRIKETLFNMINMRVPGARFLDLFGGSGAIGIEALSRGAESAVFVEHNKAAYECIMANLKFTKLTSGANVIYSDSISSIKRLYDRGEKFDIIFMDPPYGKSIEKEAFTSICLYDILDTDGIIIIEAKADTDFSYIDEASGFFISKTKNYGSNKHIFVEKR